MTGYSRGVTGIHLGGSRSPAWAHCSVVRESGFAPMISAP